MRARAMTKQNTKPSAGVECIHLRDRFGDRYKVACEASYYAQYGANARGEDPWLQIIPCRYGHIFPHGGATLAVSVDGHPQIASRIALLRCCHVAQDGDRGELTANFHVDDFDAVAEIVRPRRKRQISVQERIRLAEMGRANLKRLRERNVDGQRSDVRRRQTSARAV